MRRERRQDVLDGAVLVDVSRDTQRRELTHLVGVHDRTAEDQDRKPALVELPDRADQVDAGRVRQAEIEHDEIDLLQIGPHAGQQLRRALDDDRLVPGGLERGAKTVAYERRVVGDDDCLDRDRGVGHLTTRPNASIGA